MFVPSFLALVTTTLLLQCNGDTTKNPLHIVKVDAGDDRKTPIDVEVSEKGGTNFSLVCMLDPSFVHNYASNQTNDLRFWREKYISNSSTGAETLSRVRPYKMYSFDGDELSMDDVAVKEFKPLQPQDGGAYWCVSLRYNLYRAFNVTVLLDNGDVMMTTTSVTTSSCGSTTFFECTTLRSICIAQRFVCDGVADCKDGSDEAYDICHGDPCQGKLRCDDGRCIPLKWCCDKYHDPNCTVRHRHECCRTIENFKNDGNRPTTMIQQHHQRHHTHSIHTNNSGRYLFISVCILTILLFVILLFLVVSKVIKLAQKSSSALLRLQQQQQQQERHLHHHYHYDSSGPTSPFGNTTTTNNNNNNNMNNGSSSHMDCDTRDGARINVDRFLTSNTLMDGYDMLSVPLLLDDPLPLLDSCQRHCNEGDQPPPYTDAICGRSPPVSYQCLFNVNEPPPPYTSREVLNSTMD